MPAMRMFWSGLLGVSLFGCAEDTFEFVCQSDSQCDEQADGICVVEWCAYREAACSSGYRYSEDAEASLAAECVEESDLPPR